VSRSGAGLLNLNCHVRSVRRDGDKYRLRWTRRRDDDDGDDDEEEGAFDGVIVSSGFFSAPKLVPSSEVDLRSFTGSHVHSSAYSSGSDYDGRSVAILGSSFSALQIACDVSKSAERAVVIVARIPWVIPRFLPLNDGSGGFAPLDMVLYRRTADGAAATEEDSFAGEEGWRRKHDYLEGVVGRKQRRAFGCYPPRDLPPRVVVSDEFLDLVAVGRIEVVEGRLVGSDGGRELIVEGKDSGRLRISGIDSLISCTGYRTQLDFLSRDILEVLEYDPDDGFAPLTLCDDMYHPLLPNLGFVGMYNGPYFGVMELQARYLANRFSSYSSSSQQHDDKNDNDAALLNISRQIRNQSPRPQYARADYPGRMDALARRLHIIPQFAVKNTMITPAFYTTSDHSSSTVAERVKNALAREISDCRNGKYSARTVLSGLLGTWRFERRIVRHDEKDATSHVKGEVTFCPRKDGSVKYREEGVFRINGREFEVFREYDYVLRGELLEVYFVEGGERAHLFLSLKFRGRRDDETEDYVEATSDHLCIKDLYKGTFRVKFDGVAIEHVEMQYNVRGPQKDYTAVTRLEPVEN